MRRHNLVVGDPLFDNLRGTLAAFIGFRRAIGTNAPCEIRFTFPRKFAGELPSTLSEIASIGTNCSTNTFPVEDPDPEVEKERASGMLAETLVVHIRKDQKGGMELTDSLASLVRLELKYEVPANSHPNLVWFQVGNGARWNSELLQH